MLTGKGSPVDMFSSSSPSLPHGHSSVRSSCGSETAEVLLRSTRVLLSDRSRGSESGPRSVHISVQKLPDSTGVRPKRTEPEPKPKKHTHPPGSPEVEPEPGLLLSPWQQMLHTHAEVHLMFLIYYSLFIQTQLSKYIQLHHITFLTSF